MYEADKVWEVDIGVVGGGGGGRGGRLCTKVAGTGPAWTELAAGPASEGVACTVGEPRSAFCARAARPGTVEAIVALTTTPGGAGPNGGAVGGRPPLRNEIISFLRTRARSAATPMPESSINRILQIQKERLPYHVSSCCKARRPNKVSRDPCTAGESHDNGAWYRRLDFAARGSDCTKCGGDCPSQSREYCA